MFRGLSFFHGGHGGELTKNLWKYAIIHVQKIVTSCHRWRCSVSTALIIYLQMSDRCYTDFHLFQICLTSVDCIGPQADGRCGQELP